MGLGFKDKIRSKNKMIDKRIRRQGEMVDDEIEDFMISKKRNTLLGLRKDMGNAFG